MRFVHTHAESCKPLDRVATAHSSSFDTVLIPVLHSLICVFCCRVCSGSSCACGRDFHARRLVGVQSTRNTLNVSLTICLFFFAKLSLSLSLGVLFDAHSAVADASGVVRTFYKVRLLACRLSSKFEIRN